MQPPIVDPVKQSTAVQALLGDNPVRFYPELADQNTTRPYAVWQDISGFPWNTLNDIPRTDTYVVQIDVYANPGRFDVALDVARTLREVIEEIPGATVRSLDGKFIDPDTNYAGYRFTVEFMTPRDVSS